MGRINFEGRNILVTGASTGIGRALSKEFGKRGAHLALGSLPEEEDILTARARQLEREFGISTWVFPINLLDREGPDELYHRVTDRVGEIYALVNNAGTVSYGNFWERSWDPQYATFMLNLYVPMRLMYLFLPGMVSRGEGCVFNTSSVSGLQPTPFQSVYGASKAGLQSLSQGVRAELMGTGVTVCTINPPYIDTRLLRAEGYPRDLRFYTISGKKSPEWLAKKALKAFEKGKMMHVPGFTAKLIHLVLIRLSPRRLVDYVSRFAMQGWSEETHEG